jgi:hypothetical protein
MPDGGLIVSRRSLARTRSGIWRLQAKSPKPPRRRAVYLLRPVPEDPDGDLLTLRIPANSRIVPTLDGLVPSGSEAPPS